jgi:NitT/TauT family transport system ATP-binding protein
MVFVTHSIEEAVLMGDRVVVLKGRPSTVSEIVEVDLPRPRTRETLASPLFAKLREHVWNTLMDEARRAEFQVEGCSTDAAPRRKNTPPSSPVERMDP